MQSNASPSWAEGQRALVERVARGEPIGSVLCAIATAIEERVPGAICGILALDATAGTLHVVAGKSLPAAVRAASEGLPIGPDAGACGTAAFAKAEVVCADVRTDPRWRAFVDVAVSSGLLACWSHPILDSRGEVLGTFAIYRAEPGEPAPEELALAREASHVASLAMERERMTSLVRKQESAYLRLFAENPSAMWIFDTTTLAILDANDAAVRLHGWSREELLAKTVRAIVAPCELERLERAARCTAPLSPVNGNRWRHLTKDGSEIEVEVSSHAMEWRGRPARALTLVDVTEKVRVERALELSSARLGAVVATAMDGIISVDDEHRVVLFNAAAERIFRLPASEAIGKTLDRFIPPKLREGHAAHMRSFQGEGATTRSMAHAAVLSGLRADGTEFPVEATISRADVAGSAVLTVILRDVTERVRLEHQLRHAQKMDALGRLAGGVAHDFNNLLTVMSTSAELVSTACTEEGKEYAAEIVALVGRASALTRQLLSFSRRAPVELRVLSLDDVVADVQKLLGRVIGEEIRLEVSRSGGAARVLGDAGQLEQVLVNLAVNARDAMPGGGTIALRTGVVDDAAPVVRVAEALANEHGKELRVPFVHLTVRDTGVGMDEATRSRAFEPFFTTKGPGKGTGLGLATVYAIVDSAGGVTWIESEPGFGTTVHVALPLASGDGARAVKERRTVPARGGHLLLVEDEPALRRAAVRILEKAGYKVTAAANGAEALAALDEALAGGFPPALVVTDVVMPRMGGKAFVAEVRERLPDVPVVYMSGYVDGGVGPSDLDGRTVFVQKPFSSDALLGILADLNDRH